MEGMLPSYSNLSLFLLASGQASSLSRAGVRHLTDIKSTPLCEQLKAIVGSAGFLKESTSSAKTSKTGWVPAQFVRLYYCVRVHLAGVPNSGAVSRAQTPIAPQGGMTGLVSAAAPLEGEIALSFERMKSVMRLIRSPRR